MIQHATDGPPRGVRLVVVKELLRDLDTVTTAGQKFTMEKVVGMLSEEVRSVARELSELQRRALVRALEDLGRAHDHPLPDTETFVVRSQIITDTLALV